MRNNKHYLQVEKRNQEDKMSKVNIIWASMFGTAEDVAKDVFESVKNELSIDAEINEMNDVNIDTFKNMESVMFISSTTGQGDVPSNGETFFDVIININFVLFKCH